MLTKYFVNGLTTITPELRKILKDKYKLHNKKIGLWSSGVSMNIFKTENIGSKKNFHDKTKDFVLIHHGTYSPTRGIEELIESIAVIDVSLREKIKLLLVGIPDEKASDLKNLCKNIGVEKEVDIIPPVKHNEIPYYIQSSDVGIIPLPPNNEWWKVSVPLKTLEYLAMGKPIIVTDIPFHKKIFDECNCGVIIKTSNPKDISEAITYLYGKKNELKKMGESGKKLVQQSYSWDQKALELEEFINSIMVNQ